MIEQPTRRSPQALISAMLGYTVSAVSLGAGILLLTGWLISARFPDQFRIMFGVVLVLMGIYRFVLTRTKARQWDQQESPDGR